MGTARDYIELHCGVSLSWLCCCAATMAHRPAASLPFRGPRLHPHATQSCMSPTAPRHAARQPTPERRRAHPRRPRGRSLRYRPTACSPSDARRAGLQRTRPSPRDALRALRHSLYPRRGSLPLVADVYTPVVLRRPALLRCGIHPPGLSSPSFPRGRHSASLANHSSAIFTPSRSASPSLLPSHFIVPLLRVTPQTNPCRRCRSPPPTWPPRRTPRPAPCTSTAPSTSSYACSRSAASWPCAPS